MTEPIAKDLAGLMLQEGDRVVFPQSEPMNRGRIEGIRRIFQRGPYEGGVRVTIVHTVDILIPPGHHTAGVTKCVKTPDEIKEDERMEKGLSRESSLVQV